jgi:uridylate kinase
MTFVVSIGGSIVVPNGEIDADFLSGLKKLIFARAKHGDKFVIVVGGGGTCRTYQRAAKAVTKVTNEDLDWLGIHATRLNGHLMRTIFRQVAHAEMFNDPRRVPKRFREAVVVAAGWKPGWSTDYVATSVAKRLGTKVVINLSNIDYLYTKDPRKYKDATPICEIGWKAFRKMVGSTWDPGMNVPFDPVASKLAQGSGINVILANGKNLKNLEKILAGKSFIGTVIG